MYHVLLVDDEKWSINVLSKIFHWEEYGFRVSFATTSQQEALKFLDKYRVDVIILDMNMPGLSGEDMMREIRMRTDAKIVILSGYSNFSYAQHAIEHKVFRYCLKPIKQEDAIIVVEELKKALDSENNLAEEDLPANDIENYKFDNLIKYINVHCFEKLYLSELTKKFEINLTYCCSLFKKHFNMTFSEYIINLKMQKALDLIKYENMEICDVADTLNYEYVYFCKLFKKHFNKTPRQYRIECIKEKK